MKWLAAVCTPWRYAVGPVAKNAVVTSGLVLSSIKALVFDWDLTLFDRQAVVQKYYHQLAQHLLPERRTSFLEQALTLDAHGYGPKKNLFQHLSTALHQGSLSQIAQAWQTEVWQSPQAYPDAEALIDKLKTQGYRLGVFTNGSSKIQHQKMSFAWLKDFEQVFISEEVGAKKPQLKAFQIICQSFQLAPEQIMYIGDHPVLDIRGAQQAGLKTTWIQRYPWPEAVRADLIAQSLADFGRQLLGNAGQDTSTKIRAQS